LVRHCISIPPKYGLWRDVWVAVRGIVESGQAGPFSFDLPDSNLGASESDAS
jgi:hypothetical protein